MMTAIAVFLFLIALIAILFIIRAVKIGAVGTLIFITMFLGALIFLVSIFNQ
jgi:hypothetical protein